MTGPRGVLSFLAASFGPHTRVEHMSGTQRHLSLLEDVVLRCILCALGHPMREAFALTADLFRHVTKADVGSTALTVP